MAKIDGDDRELSDRDASIAKGMLARFDLQHHVAAYFGVDSRAISHIKNGKTFENVNKASPVELPPPGPYRPDPFFAAFYSEMTAVNALWNKRLMKEAKARLEAALTSPVISVERTAVDLAADGLFRDEFGIMEDFGQ